MRQGFRDHHAPLHAAGKFGDLVVALVPQGEVAQDLLDQRIVRPLAEQAPAEPHGVDHPLEHVGGEFLRHEPDGRARLAIARDDVVPGHDDPAFAGIHQAADDRDERRLARAIGPEQGEDLALLDLQVDAPERLEPIGVTLGTPRTERMAAMPAR